MTEHPIILFDGVCNFCNSIINFIIRQDEKKIFRFTPLQSAVGQRLLEKNKINDLAADSFLLLDNNKAYQYSTAGLRVYNKLPWYWKWTQLGWVLPKFIRDGIYKFIARNRYKWFGKKDQCMVPTKDVIDRFLS